MADGDEIDQGGVVADGLTVDRLAQLLVCSPRRVQQLVKEGWIERAARGYYRVLPAVQGRIRQLEDAIRRRETKWSKTSEEEITRLNKARADLAELDLLRKRGSVVDVATVESLGAAVISAVTLRVMGLRNVMPEIRAAGSDAVGVDIFDRACREALDQLSRLVDLADEAQSDLASMDGGSEAAPDAHGRGMVGQGTRALAGELPGARPVEDVPS